MTEEFTCPARDVDPRGYVIDLDHGDARIEGVSTPDRDGMVELQYPDAPWRRVPADEHVRQRRLP